MEEKREKAALQMLAKPNDGMFVTKQILLVSTVRITEKGWTREF